MTPKEKAAYLASLAVAANRTRDQDLALTARQIVAFRALCDGENDFALQIMAGAWDHTNRADIAAVLEKLLANQVDVDWYVCHADANDVAYGRAKPKATDPDYRDLKKAGKHLEPRDPGCKPGDELWRMPTSIGPITIDHDHWAGYHLACTPAQAERVAWLINHDPEFPWEAK